MQKLTDQILSHVITKRPTNSYKGTFGRVLLVGGNQNFGGAIIMATSAAIHAGAGLVTTATDAVNLGSLHASLPEAMFVNYHDKVQLSDLTTAANTVVIGPGLGDDLRSQEILATVFANTNDQQTVVIDGSAITLVAKHATDRPAGQLIYTPHQMEWQRLSGIAIDQQTPEKNQVVQQQLGATIVLKKHHTEIYSQSGIIYQLPIGTPAQATGGMGDTLAGIVGGFTAQFKTPDSILAAVYAHSAIAEEIAQTQYVVLPHQISAALPAFMQRFAN